VRENELNDLVYNVDILGKPVRIKHKSELDPIRYGVIVSHGGRRGLLLPNLEGVDTVEEQLSIALQKAGISPSSEFTIEKFEVIRHK
jgi:AMMECR1 domain-containing protein